MTASAKYLVVIELRADTSLDDLKRRVPALRDVLSRLAQGKIENAFYSTRLFGTFLEAVVSPDILRAELDKATSNGDCFMIVEVGECAGHKGMGRAATWLERR